MPIDTVPLAPQTWEFFEPKSQQWLAAQVPGCIHLDLRRHGLIPDPYYGANELDLAWIEREDWTYRAHFDVDKPLLQHEIVELVADGLDTVAVVSLNGQPIGRSENMFAAARWAVEDFLKVGRNELVIEFASPARFIASRRQPGDFHEWNDPAGGASLIRKEQCSFGWDWGARFATSGVYKDIRLEAWSTARWESVGVAQDHREDGTVALTWTGTVVEPHPEDATDEIAYRSRLLFDGQTVAETDGDGALIVHAPRLWWPNGHGAQPLYTLEVDLLDREDDSAVLDTWRRRIGLRTVVLDRHDDEYGETFQFVVNGRPLFAKGANWIPADCFVARLTRADYDDRLTDAAEVHMNMIRVWGGGIYESEDFYDLCDEKGLLVWQDFMFACALYRGDEDSLALIQDEAEYQVQRLAHRACLALWCGSNEMDWLHTQIAATSERTQAFETIFYDLLPAVVAEFDGVTTYWPCSPHHPDGWRKGGDDTAGDAHYWDVWHKRAPVKSYEEKGFRFCSEFGMQSYSSPEVAATFCPPTECNVFSPAMENHQKNAAGNQIILDYVSRLYRFPQGYEALSYLSQLNQLYCLKVGVEHFRRSMPRTMGALYWQLNDCWPVFSWSSVEYGGKWKALHYGARRFFGPALVSAHVPGEETPGIINRFASTIHDVDLYTVYDGEAPEVHAHLGWELRHLDGRRLEHGGLAVLLRRNESVCWQRLDFAAAMAEHTAAKIYLHVILTVDGRTASEDTVFLTAPRFMDLPRAPIEATVQAAAGAGGEFEIEFRSPVFQHRVKFELEGVAYRASDNFFDLHPHWPHKVRVRLKAGAGEVSAGALQAKLRTLSLVDTY